jgi:CMP-N-acetylneuraminic acid synthetase
LRYLIIIPARGGSKGIPRKNLVNLNKTPLIEYTIKAALQTSSLIKDIHVIVSTDDEDIKKISEKLGADVPFLRPDKLSGDFSPSVEYVNHAIKFFSSKGDSPENVIILQPTSPLRTSDDVVKAIKLFNNFKENTLISAYEDQTLNDKIMYTLEGHYGTPLNLSHNTGTRRQDDDPILIRNGAIYITKVKFLKENGNLFSERPIIYLMPKSRSINIDTLEDLRIAENSLN